MRAQREWVRLSLVFAALWLMCGALSVWSLHAALGTGTIRTATPVTLRAIVITQATPWLLVALLTPATVWSIGRAITGRRTGVAAWMIVMVGVAFLVLHGLLMPVLAVLLDRGEWTWPRREGAFARVWVSSLTVALQYSVMAATTLMRRSSVRTRQLEHDLMDARVHVLRTSLQPHFLFNALHSVSALIDQSPEGARRALAELGHLLRWSLDHEGRQLVTLAQELDVVERYLSIERLRMADRLRVHYDVSDAALGAPIPAFLLQPLVENAVRHGIAPRETGGDLRIVARLERRHLVVSVHNPVGERPLNVGAGVGQRHVRDRLHSLYGARASFEQVQQGGWYDVTMRWPVDRSAGTS